MVFVRHTAAHASMLEQKHKTSPIRSFSTEIKMPNFFGKSNDVSKTQN